MKEKFNYIYETVSDNMKRLDAKELSIDQAKAMAALAKQANNILVTQLAAAKFLADIKENEKYLNDVGL